MQHSFDISIAEKFGINVAIFLNNMAFWIKKNQANNKHFHDGRYWTYNSQEAFTELFPYWSRQNIRTILKACETAGLLIKGNFNETGYDRTTWYGLTDLGLSLFSCFNKEQLPIGENQPIDLLKPTESLVRTNQPIPDIKPDIKPDKRKERGKKRLSTHSDNSIDYKSSKIPSDFTCSQENLLLAAQLHLDAEQERCAFIDKCKAENWRSHDWPAQFNVWLRRAKAYEKKNAKKEHPVTTTLNSIKEDCIRTQKLNALLTF